MWRQLKIYGIFLKMAMERKRKFSKKIQLPKFAEKELQTLNGLITIKRTVSYRIQGNVVLILLLYAHFSIRKKNLHLVLTSVFEVPNTNTKTRQEYTLPTKL